MSQIDPNHQRKFAIQVVKKLRGAGYNAYWAGGCVRDLLLDLQPKDYDVATSASPDQISTLFGRRRTLPIGAAFGVITVRGPKIAGQIEVATFREDGGYSDGRRPDSVSFSTAEHDAQRRDFTINGLFYDPEKKKVIDFVRGQEDLKRKCIRAIGIPRDRFGEDKLRMLRGIRFAATFQFQLDHETLKAIQEMAHEVTVVSAERIGAEMRRMLTHATRAVALRLLRDSTLLEVLLPEVASLYQEQSDGVPWDETLRVLAALYQPSLPLALAALLHRAGGKPLAETAGRRWRLPNKETRRTAWLVEHYRRVDDCGTLPWSKLQRLLISEGMEELLALYEAINGQENGQLARCRQCLALPAEQLNPAPLVTGDDLIEHGIRPGKQFQVLLERVRDAQLDKLIATRAEGLALVDRLMSGKE